LTDPDESGSELSGLLTAPVSPPGNPAAGFFVATPHTGAQAKDPMAARRKPKKAANSPKKGRGRPTDYRPEHCATVIALGREGKSRAQIAAALDQARQTLHDWEKAHPEFLDAMRRAHDLALAWWEDQGQLGIWSSPMSRTLNSTAYGLQMRNRFPDDYKRPDTVVDLNLDEVRAAIYGKLARLAAAGAPKDVPSKPKR
tara:strand:- start:8420 stop:9016 length:597 start_codon:yes stop_codon:yes gene_type:complete